MTSLAYEIYAPEHHEPCCGRCGRMLYADETLECNDCLVRQADGTSGVADDTGYILMSEIPHSASILCRGCGRELYADEIGECSVCLAEAAAGTFAVTEDKSGYGSSPCDLTDAWDPQTYWYWLGLVDTMQCLPGQPTNIERQVTTFRALLWVERYEQDCRDLSRLYDWYGIDPDTPFEELVGLAGGGPVRL